MRPLPGLDAVPWSTLHGSYTSAEDVPERIEALRSADAAVRRAALAALTSAVVHQGTLWQISSHVVPFIVDLIDDPATRDRGQLLRLLREVSLGHLDDHHLPFDPDSHFDTREVTQEQENVVIERMYYLEEDFAEDWLAIAEACAVKWAASAYWAAAARLDAYRRWLADTELASGAAELLAWFPPTRETVSALLAVEGDDESRAAANLTLAHLAVEPGEVAPLLTRRLDDASPVVRLTAAVALAYHLGEGMPPRAVEILIEAKDLNPLPGFPWRDRAQRKLVVLALRRIGLAMTDRY